MADPDNCIAAFGPLQTQDDEPAHGSCQLSKWFSLLPRHPCRNKGWAHARGSRLGRAGGVIKPAIGAETSGGEAVVRSGRDKQAAAMGGGVSSSSRRCQGHRRRAGRSEEGGRFIACKVVHTCVLMYTLVGFLSRRDQLVVVVRS